MSPVICHYCQHPSLNHNLHLVHMSVVHPDIKLGVVIYA